MKAAPKPRSHQRPRRRHPLRRAFAHIALCLALAPLAFAPQVRAQGCTQCLDSTRATPPRVQAAYRHAIYLLGGFGVTLFLGGLILLRREQ
jgi:hypothetical protein